MWDRFRQAGRCGDLASSNMGNFGLPTLTGLIELAGLCGVAFFFGAGGAAFVENSHFWTADAIAATKDEPQAVNRLRKGDRLPAMIVDPWTGSAEPQDSFGTLEVGGPPNATITIKDAAGRLVFELDPLRRATVISKREPRRVPSSKEPGAHIAPKSRVAPLGSQDECDPRSCRTADVTPRPEASRFPS